MLPHVPVALTKAAVLTDVSSEITGYRVTKKNVVQGRFNM